MMKEKIKHQGGDDEQSEKDSRRGRDRIRDHDDRKCKRARDKTLSLRLRSAEDDGLWHSRRYLCRQAQGAEQGHHADRPVSRRAARAGAAGAAARQSRRRGVLHFLLGECRDAVAAGRRDVDVAENGVNVYLANKHYEVAPVLSMTEHEANNSLVWVSDKLWNSLTPDQQGWMQAAADEVNKNQPARAIDLEHQSQEKLKSIGVKVVTDVGKSSFIAVADPLLDKLAKELGPHAQKIKNLIPAIN